MKLYSWNINGFRAICAKPHWAWFRDLDGAIVGLQETRAAREQIPEEHRSPPGYHAFWLSGGRQGYSGVAVFSQITPLAVHYELPQAAWQGEGRLIHLECPDFHYFNVYFPNSQKGGERLHYKLGFYEAFIEYAQTLRRTKPVVVCGDFNIAHRPIDLTNPEANAHTPGFLPEERACLDKLVSLGYLDALRLIQGDHPGLYSWWSYRENARRRNQGWRIDYFFVSGELKDKVMNA